MSIDPVPPEPHHTPQKASIAHNGAQLMRKLVHRHGVPRTTLFVTVLSITMSVVVGGVLTPLLIGPPTLGTLALTILVPAIIAPPIIYLSMRMLHELDIAEGKLQHISTIDELTGIFNRRHFIHTTRTALAHAFRYEQALSLIVMDLDHFKQVNDTLGHQAGDRVLTEVVDRAMSCLRTSDVFARYGGEEFVILLPNTALEGALNLAERILVSVSERAIETGYGTIDITVSLGVTSLLTDDDCIEDLLDRADRALYAAKAQGRNRVAMH